MPKPLILVLKKVVWPASNPNRILMKSKINEAHESPNGWVTDFYVWRIVWILRNDRMCLKLEPPNNIQNNNVITMKTLGARTPKMFMGQCRFHFRTQTHKRKLLDPAGNPRRPNTQNVVVHMPIVV